MDIEQLEKIESRVARMKLIRKNAELFCTAEIFALRLPEGQEVVLSNLDSLSDADKTLYKEITEALLQYYRLEYRAVRSQLAELGVTMPYNDDIKITGVGPGY